MKRWMSVLGVLVLVVFAATAGWRVARWSDRSIDPTVDAAARVGAQVWAQEHSLWDPTTRIETILQFEGCSSMNVYPKTGDSVPLVVVQRGSEWKASKAANGVNDADDVHSAQDCVGRFEEGS